MRHHSARFRTGRAVHGAAAAPLGKAVVVLGLFVLGSTPSASAQAQVSSPVYVDDSPAAVEGVRRIREHLGAGEVEKAVRLIQRLIVEEGDRLVPGTIDPELYISVRTRLHQLLLNRPAALEAYREIEGPVAARLLEEGRVAQVEHDYLMTRAGLEATLRVAQEQIEGAAFAGAWRTLNQLENHPDRQGEAASAAASLMALAARYIDDAHIDAQAARWAEEAALNGGEVKEIAGPDLNRGGTPFDSRPGIDLSEIILRPFWTEAMTLEPEQARISPNNRATQAPANTRLLYIFPAVAGDTIYVNDGQAISAWDRFTMSLQWRTSALQEIPERARGTAYGRLRVEDPNTVTVFGPWVFATTGLANQGERHGDPSLHALDAATGERIWSVNVSELSPALEEGSIRGPALVEQGLVIVAVSKQIKQRRLLSLHLVGLDPGSGSLVWERPLGSRGILPYATTGRNGEAAKPHRGAVLQASSLGFVASVEAATGRVEWLRRFDVEMSLPQVEQAWQTPSSIVMGDRLYTIAPDQTSILALDVATGEVVSKRPAVDFERPHYLLATDDDLIAVGERFVYAIRESRFDDSQESPRLIATAPGGGFWGRAVVAGEEVIAPLMDGIMVASIDAASGDVARHIRLDQPGTVLPAEGQLVVVDDLFTHSYLIWDVAERILAERMRMSPSDPTPAATYAELAHRAGRFDKILDALDSALEAIERSPLDATNRRVRDRLFESVSMMTDPTADEDAGNQPPAALVTKLLVRQERLASTAEERVIHLLSLGSHEERQGNQRSAVDAYQRILDDERLADASLMRRGVSLQAEIEATRRLRNLIRIFGRELYAAYDAEAARELEMSRDELDPDAFLRIARRFPVSTSAPAAWLEAASAYASRAQANGSIYALERGLDAAEGVLSGDDPVVSELAGRLVQQLIRQERVAAAAAQFARVRDRWPMAMLTENGSPLDLAQVETTISDRLARQQRRPLVREIGEDALAQLLMGWRVAAPVMPERSAAASEFVMLRNANELALWGIDSKSGLTKRWSVEADDRVTVLTMTEESVVLATATDDGVALTRVDLGSGKRTWSSLPFDDHFAEAAGGRRDEERQGAVENPVFGARPGSEMLAVRDDRTLALIERGGRAAAFDLHTGRTLWTKKNILTSVNDASLASGQLLIGGAQRIGGEAGMTEPALQLFEARSGREMQSLPAEDGGIRWVRILADGGAVVGA
ncbi:MAG: PQQ-binding-like beta-propeller repeat protein, partial [Planctomycetota bacterium]|nr:PQQ-binding-like beta-propeller repeat protein [Planctomycetota bacterium]